ncbi:pyridoxamine 5'-phosphate oxidase family protein [Modestobacter marinus]|uniref:Pyridoxamine 5'-phosphate oxidase n=1 Tax=Modestobacter marinus TaxID=477641 RepID=A0ABQ2G5N7_9ACTN|nr:pyridoxamine 5'-phosphate oxidase [Modestobacter marinus]
MDTPYVDHEVEVLDEAECLALMGTVLVGRIAFTERALPAVQPVAFALAHGEVYIPVHRGSTVAAASRGAVVAFAVDEIDALALTGWNVTVVGASRLISDPAAVRRLDELGLRPWAPADAHCYIGIQTGLVHGRRVSPRTGSVDGVVREAGRTA